MECCIPGVDGLLHLLLLEMMQVCCFGCVHCKTGHGWYELQVEL